MNFRASEIKNIMTDPRSKSEVLSEGAKTFLETKAKETFFGVDLGFQYSKYTEKGKRLEQSAIEFVNDTLFESYVKNKERKTLGGVTGECDIYDERKSQIIDIKCSWSLGTFPVFSKELIEKEKEYYWQMQCYMYLWNCTSAKIIVVGMDTPEDLRGFEPIEWHTFSDKPSTQRITEIVVERDDVAIEKMLNRVKVASQYYRELLSL